MFIIIIMADLTRLIDTANAPIFGVDIQVIARLPQSVALAPRETHSWCFFQSCFPSGVSLDFEQLLLKI